MIEADRAGYVMTGITEQEDIWGRTEASYFIPDNYWKLICYRSWNFISRDQADILRLLTVRLERFVREAWTGAANYLHKNRNETRTPSPEECINKLTVTDAVKNEWSNRMKAPPTEYEIENLESPGFR